MFEAETKTRNHLELRTGWVTIHKEGQELCCIPYNESNEESKQQAIARAKQIIAALEISPIRLHDL